ncbi:hexose carrier protein [Aspergillus ibericus CBS 121593]|uniref:Hexose carrier protein n=1 Tax=Aspergillus ibericus CBS 121593 TaxID=1448316 RepID=A0A395GRZ9_9EURO|nr:hexose carrier protein [Aspergillus ibericus CBS 121593]RAK98152.1 hexose carrier protein [Aspergillus ibericus CBS 121593]
MTDRSKDDQSSEVLKNFATAEHDETVGTIESTDVAYSAGGISDLFRSWYVFGSAALASLGGFSMGYNMGVISIVNVMKQFHQAFPRSESAFGKGLMTGMMLLGAFTAAQNYDMLVAGRFIGGIGVGTLAMAPPSTSPKSSPPPELRGILLVLESISITLGVAIAYWITYATRFVPNEVSFRLPFGLQMLTATILGVGIHLFPYSPRWLALVDRQDDCLSSLSKLRGLPPTDPRIQTEFPHHPLRNHLPAPRLKLELVSWLDLFSRGMWKRLAVGCGVPFFQQFSGINAFIYYAPTLFESLGQSDDMSKILSGVFDLIQVVAAVLCAFIIEKVGRRALAIYGAFGMALAYIIIAILSGLYSDNWENHVAAGWACVAMAFIFILVYGVSYSPLGWALPAEVFPNACRSKGVALATCTIWLADFVVGIVTPSMLADIGYRTYVFFAVMCTVAGVEERRIVREAMVAAGDLGGV